MLLSTTTVDIELPEKKSERAMNAETGNFINEGFVRDPI